jgi:hypothetical protein
MSTSPQAAPNPETAPETSPQHDAKGRFARGNAGGPGNPFGRQVAELRKTLLVVVTPERFRTLVDSLVTRAANGDNVAAKLVLQYTLGKPAAAVEPDRVDLDEYRLREASAIPQDDWVPTLGNWSASAINQLADKCQRSFDFDNDKVLVGGVPMEKETPASRRAARKAKKRRLRAKDSPSPNGSDGRKKTLRFDKHGFPLDMGFGPDFAG